MVDSLPPDPFTALGISKDASTAQIKTAYKKAALKVHPDKATDKDAAVDAFHRINQAYELLTDPEKRQKYEDQLRTSHLKRDAFERKGAGAFSSSYSTHHSQHARGSSGEPPRTSYFSPRTAHPTFSAEPHYEERRPRQPMHDDETSFFSRYDSYPREGTSARKSDAFASTRRTPPKASSRASEAPRASTRSSDKEPPPPKTKEKDRVAQAKKRDQDIRKERVSKTTRVPSLSESETDASIDDRRAPRMSGRARMRSPDSDADRWDQRFHKYNEQIENQRMHINASRTRDVSPGIGQDYRSEAFSGYGGSSRREAPEPERRSSRDARPGFFRRSSSKAKDPPPPVSGRSRAASVADKKPPSSSARLKTDHPSLFTSSSTPANGSRLQNMVNPSGRGRSASDDDDETQAYSRPGMKRSETLPMRPSRQNSFSARRQSESRAPPHPIKTGQYGADPRGNDDSGYSTSNSPSESPENEHNDYPQTAPARTQTYNYAPKRSATMDSFPRSTTSERFASGINTERTPRTAQSERFPGPAPAFEDDYTDFRPMDYGRSPRFQTVPEVRSPSGRMRDSPSPHSRNPSSRNPFSAPPPSRSASFQPGRSGGDSDRDRDRDRDREPSTSSRRPSLSRSGSSKTKVPSLSRASTTPLQQLNTKIPPQRDPHLYFGEVPTSSPTEYYSGSGPESGRERERDRDRRRMSEDARPSSGGSSRPVGGSARPSRGSTMESVMSRAKKHIERAGDERGAARSPLTRSRLPSQA